MSSEKRGPSSSFAVGHAPARVADTKPRQQTPDEKDEAAETLAGDLERQAQLVRDDVAAIRIAAAAEDLADWTDAANDAAVGLLHVRELVKKASRAKLDATDARVRACLENAAQVLADTEALIAGAPAAPKLGAPVVRCADALLAVLAPDRPPRMGSGACRCPAAWSSPTAPGSCGPRSRTRPARSGSRSQLDPGYRDRLPDDRRVRRADLPRGLPRARRRSLQARGGAGDRRGADSPRDVGSMHGDDPAWSARPRPAMASRDQSSPALPPRRLAMLGAAAKIAHRG